MDIPAGRRPISRDFIPGPLPQDRQLKAFFRGVIPLKSQGFRLSSGGEGDGNGQRGVGKAGAAPGASVSPRDAPAG